MIIKDLVDFGLSEKESKVYIALLEIGCAKVQDVLKITNLNRSSIYVILECLKNKGLISILPNKNVKEYIAVSPEVFQRKAKEKFEHQRLILSKIENIIPEMKALQKYNNIKPLIKVFEGKEGIINAFEDTLTVKNIELRIYSSPNNLGQIVEKYMPYYIKQRYKLNIKMLGIHPKNNFTEFLVKNSPKNFDKVILIPEDKYKFPADIAIYNNKFVICLIKMEVLL